VLRPSGVCDQIVLSVDVPSPLTATGTKLVLDGEDTALVRASLTDGSGALCSAPSRDTLVQFAVAGAGRIVGAASGSPTAANGTNHPAGTSVVRTFGGMASAVVQVTLDCTSAHREAMRAVDADGGQGPVVVVGEAQVCDLAPIVITATITAPGVSGEATQADVHAATASIAVSNDSSAFSPLAVARQGHDARADWPFFDAFVG